MLRGLINPLYEVRYKEIAGSGGSCARASSRFGRSCLYGYSGTVLSISAPPRVENREEGRGKREYSHPPGIVLIVIGILCRLSIICPSTLSLY